MPIAAELRTSLRVSHTLTTLRRADRPVGILGAMTALLAPSASPHAQPSLSPPTPIANSVPAPPKNQFGAPMEGWIKLRYTVRADGTTSDVRVVDTMPPQLPTRDAIRAVEEWKFAPAANDGEPIEWYNNESIVVFDDAAVPLEPAPMFVQSYLSVAELLEQQKYEQAKAANERLLTTFASRLSEIGLLQTQSAIASIAAADMHGAYAAIRRATEPDVVTLPENGLRDALQIRFAVELELGHVMEALDTFERREALGTPEGDPLAAQARAIEEALKSDAPIVVKGRVDRDPWAHVPRRRTFTFADVDGDIREIQVECDRRKQVLEYVAEVDWTLPAGWGSCILFVEAKRDTTFALYEFP